MDESLQVEAPGTPLRVVRQDRQNPANRILRRVRELCRWRQETFPGSQPVSLTRTNMLDLNRTSYVACEKTDGVRYLLLAASEKVFLIDRLETVRSLNLHLPQRFMPNKSHQLTLLDGELVSDTVSRRDPDSDALVEVKVTRYLIYDGMAINGQCIMDLNLLERLSQVYLNVVKPRVDFEASNPDKLALEKATNDYLEIYLKVRSTGHLLGQESFASRLPHLSDGIIFTRVSYPYTPGSCNGLLKWKPPHLNTVDFFAEIITEARTVGFVKNNGPQSRKRAIGGVRLLVGRKGYRVFTGKWLSLEGEKCKELLSRFENGEGGLNMTIWECYYDFNVITRIPSVLYGHDQQTETFDFRQCKEEKGGWCVERVRTDKSTPNDERVIERVFESICDGVTFDELVSTFEQYRLNGKRTVASSCVLPSYYDEFGSKTTIEKTKTEGSTGADPVTTASLEPATTSLTVKGEVN